MSLLQDLIIEKKDDLSRLPKDVLTAIKSNIRKGAEDLQQEWANALELVHKAYEVEGVQRPTPDMETAWKQYEENLQYAVQQLSSNRGMDASWRMASSMFREALTQKQYKVLMGDNESIVEASNFDEIVDTIKKQTYYDVLVEHVDFNEITIRFSRFGIRKNSPVRVIRL